MTTNRARTGSPRKKAHHFNALARKRARSPKRLASLERRDRAQSAHLAAVRASLRSHGLGSSPPRINERRAQYLEMPRAVPAVVPSKPFSQPLVGAVILAFLVPLFLALSTDFEQSAHPARRPILVARHEAAAHNRVAAKNPATVVTGASAAAHAAPLKPSMAVAARQVTGRAPRASTRPAPLAAAAPQRSATATGPPQRAVVTNHLLASVLQLMFGAHAQPTRASAMQPLARPQARRIALAPHSAPAQRQPPPAPPPIARSAKPWTLSADGTWVATVQAPENMADASFSTSTGQLIELERSAVSPATATVTIGWSRPVSVTISSAQGSLTKDFPAPDAGTEAFDTVARAVGPYLIDVGWTPLSAASGVSQYDLFRSTGEGERPVLLATLSASKHSFRDDSVSPASQYRYSVVAETGSGAIQASANDVQTPLRLPGAPASVIGGKGMFLYFSSLSGDPRNFHRYDPSDVIAEAQRAGIRVIELRMARGACTMAQTRAARQWLDRLINTAAAANIKLLAWTVPRSATTQDLSETVAATAYTTENGNGFAGLALDLETGAQYMGDGEKARAGMVQYIRQIRAAVGPHYLIVATVASPQMGNAAGYPYAAIARYADVLQPMEYWHYFDQAVHHEYARGEVAQAAASAVARTRELAGRDIPVDVAGQSVDLEGTGAPSGREILWSLHAAKSVGAVGETFFDWAGTRPDAWAAIQAFDW